METLGVHANILLLIMGGTAKEVGTTGLATMPLLTKAVFVVDLVNIPQLMKAVFVKVVVSGLLSITEESANLQETILAL